jgi:hypothetical protein
VNLLIILLLPGLLVCAAAAEQPRQPADATLSAQAAPAPPARAPAPMTADELILQFKRPHLKTALRNAPRAAPARKAVQRALDALGQRQGVALHYVQTLGVGSALVAVAPASVQLDALVVRLAADAEVESVEVNARMTPFRPGPR